MTEQPSILRALEGTRVETNPFPHLVVENALPGDLFSDLARTYPSFKQIVGERQLRGNHAYLRSAYEVLADSAIPALWRDFFAYHTSQDFLDEILSFWEPVIRAEYPDIDARFGKTFRELKTGIRQRGLQGNPDNRNADVCLDVQFGVNSPADGPSTVRGAHVDKPYKLLAALLYFRHPDDDAEGGDLALYRFRTRRYSFDGRLDLRDRYVEPVKTIPYRANTLIMWVNTARSLHGVTARPRSRQPRRYVNLLAECYGLRTDGFFPIRRNLIDRMRIGARRLAGFRDA